MHFSSPSDFEREAFTRVLMGHIALAQAVFPPGTVGPTLDAFARQSLWAVGLDYVHGTGHGVGAFLNVHEGPIGISSSGRSHSALTTPLQAGMVLSNGTEQRALTASGVFVHSVTQHRLRLTRWISCSCSQLKLP